MNKLKFLIFGAGATGRGHLGQLLYEEDCELVFVDKIPELVNAINKNNGYRVILLTGDNEPERVCEIQGVTAIHRKDEDAIIEQFCKSDIILTSVIAENLPNIALIIAKCIKERFKRNITIPINIVCCENLNNASFYLKSMVLPLLTEVEKDYCTTTVGFPDAMISRVVPIPVDPLAIVTEDYNEWTVNKFDYLGELAKINSMDIVNNLEARLERKLWIHNGGHATLAYAGYLGGYKYIHEALANEYLANFTVAVLSEIGNCIIHKHNFDEEIVRKYEADLGRRGAISEMKDSIDRVIRDPLRKLNITDRLLAPTLYAFRNNLPHDNLIKSIINVTKYKSDNDIESINMHKIIEEKGFEYFIYETLGLKIEPKLADKIIKAREE